MRNYIIHAKIHHGDYQHTETESGTNIGKILAVLGNRNCYCGRTDWQLGYVEGQLKQTCFASLGWVNYQLRVIE